MVQIGTLQGYCIYDMVKLSRSSRWRLFLCGAVRLGGFLFWRVMVDKIDCQHLKSKNISCLLVISHYFAIF